jgi:Zinc carboxypeptidase/N-acetylmuramoyl-L-alanine amidase
VKLAAAVVGLALTVPATAPSAAVSPPIKKDHIPYPESRKRQMARYSKRHYGARSWRLTNKKVIVLHFTGGGSYAPAWNYFASNTPARGELPGVCAHYIVGKDGTIHEVVRPRIRCRHAIGLNHVAIGIEMVQRTGAGSHWADQQILHRKPQISAALRLVAYLRQRFDIKLHNVIGHSMANDSPFFKDLEGWVNDHTDWLRRDVRVFRKRLKKMNDYQQSHPRSYRSTTAPSSVKRVTIGHSVDGRAIRGTRLGRWDAAHTALVVGCIHGNECAGKAVLRSLRKLAVPDDLKVWIIPALNPDGAEANTRQNARGVDLNRNFARKWKPIGEPWDTYYSGPKPFSEPETRAARRFILNRKPDVTIWYHQAMALIYRSAGRRDIQARYADLVNLPLKVLKVPPGAATRWQNHRVEKSTAFVVELRAGPLSKRAAKRHARAVLKVGVM